jgi:predicted nucleic acid-binding protein
MHYLDTNVLIYACVNQDYDKMKQSQILIRELQNRNELLLSPLSLQEFIFTLSKINVHRDHIKNNYNAFSFFCRYPIHTALLDDAVEACLKLNFCRNINDVIHLKFSEQHCSELSTFDKDFIKLNDISHIKINIL